MTAFKRDLELLCNMDVNDEKFNGLLESVKTSLRTSRNNPFECKFKSATFIYTMCHYVINGGGLTDWVRELFDVLLNLPTKKYIISIINNAYSDVNGGNNEGNEGIEIWLNFVNDIFDEYKASNEFNRVVTDSLYALPTDAFGSRDINEYISTYANRPSLNMDFSKLRKRRKSSNRRSRSPPSQSSKRSRSPRRKRSRSPQKG